MPNYSWVTVIPDLAKSELDEPEAGMAEPRGVPEGRRSLLQIKVDILKTVSAGFGKPTQIMYRANLSWNVLQVQLKSFLQSGMLEVIAYGSRRRYLITPKGTEMVNSYEKVVKEILR